MIIALELAGWLNESNLALQGVVQCYGLVAPLIFYKIPSIPVFQVRANPALIVSLGRAAPKFFFSWVPGGSSIFILWVAGAMLFSISWVPGLF